MTALLTLESTEKKIVFAILVSLISLVYPEIGLGASLQTEAENQPLVFEIKNQSIKTEFTTPLNSLAFSEVIENDPLVIKLEQYLIKYKSPLAEYSDEIVLQPQWKRALAISFVESNMGLRCHDNNCSGIGVKPGHKLWRKYKTKLDWFVDMNQLLEKPMYKEKYTTFRKMKGVYVQPGSERWVRGAEKIHSELTALEQEAQTERLLALENQKQVESSSVLVALANWIKQD
ncbi:MAG: hypothetical protein Q8Q90_01780 [bacterium]|nr:hypothetical protein [bacterium]